jgi:hypothetical protein
MRGEVLAPARLVAPGTEGLELPAPGGPCPGTQRVGDSPLEACALAGIKKNAQKQGRTIIFVDESGLSERPHRCRTWAPRGQTPVLQYAFTGKTLSAIAGVTWWNFYFRLYPGSIRAPQVVEFLTPLLRPVRGKVLVIWDGLPVHRSRPVQQFVAEQGGRLQVERLPAYAPELNPVEYLWGYWKQHELPNFCPQSFGSSASTLGKPCAACGDVPRWSRPFGSKRSSLDSVTILYHSQ